MLCILAMCIYDHMFVVWSGIGWCMVRKRGTTPEVSILQGHIYGHIGQSVFVCVFLHHGISREIIQKIVWEPKVLPEWRMGVGLFTHSNEFVHGNLARPHPHFVFCSPRRWKCPWAISQHEGRNRGLDCSSLTILVCPIHFYCLLHTEALKMFWSDFGR